MAGSNGMTRTRRNDKVIGSRRGSAARGREREQASLPSKKGIPEVGGCLWVKHLMIIGRT